jgi:hypothetical protein
MQRDPQVILFFDRSVGKSIPEALRLMKLPVGIEYHQLHFPIDEADDVWLPVVGSWGWTVIGQDYKYHLNENEAAALRQHSMGCFYLWGAEAHRWDTMRLFARTYDKILAAAKTAPRPFVYDVQLTGRLKPLPL